MFTLRTAIAWASDVFASQAPQLQSGDRKVLKQEETMIPGQFTYHRPDNLADAVKLLVSFGD